MFMHCTNEKYAGVFVFKNAGVFSATAPQLLHRTTYVRGKSVEDVLLCFIAYVNQSNTWTYTHWQLN